MPAKITHSLQQTIRQQLEGTYPNEGGGFLLGIVEGETHQVLDVIQVENVFETEEQYHRYAMTPQNWAQMEDEAEERGLTLIGYYHSHPDSAAIPSEYDRVHALPHFLYIITSVRQGQSEEMTAWLLKDDRSSFEQLALEISNETV